MAYGFNEQWIAKWLRNLAEHWRNAGLFSDGEMPVFDLVPKVYLANPKTNITAAKLVRNRDSGNQEASRLKLGHGTVIIHMYDFVKEASDADAERLSTQLRETKARAVSDAEGTGNYPSDFLEMEVYNFTPHTIPANEGSSINKACWTLMCVSDTFGQLYVIPQPQTFLVQGLPEFGDNPGNWMEYGKVSWGNYHLETSRDTRPERDFEIRNSGQFPGKVGVFNPFDYDPIKPAVLVRAEGFSAMQSESETSEEDIPPTYTAIAGDVRDWTRYTSRTDGEDLQPGDVIENKSVLEYAMSLGLGYPNSGFPLAVVQRPRKAKRDNEYLTSFRRNLVPVRSLTSNEGIPPRFSTSEGRGSNYPSDDFPELFGHNPETLKMDKSGINYQCRQYTWSHSGSPILEVTFRGDGNGYNTKKGTRTTRDGYIVINGHKITIPNSFFRQYRNSMNGNLVPDIIPGDKIHVQFTLPDSVSRLSHFPSAISGQMNILIDRWKPPVGGLMLADTTVYRWMEDIHSDYMTEKGYNIGIAIPLVFRGASYQSPYFGVGNHFDGDHPTLRHTDTQTVWGTGDVFGVVYVMHNAYTES